VGCDGFDFRRRFAHVSAMPDAGDEGVRIANQNFIRAARRFIFAFALGFGDERELLRTPVVFAFLRQFALGVFAAVFGNPDGLVTHTQILRHRVLTVYFRAKKKISFRTRGAAGRHKKPPAPKGIRPAWVSKKRKVLLFFPQKYVPPPEKRRKALA